MTRSEATAARWDVLGPQRLVDGGLQVVLGFFMTSLGLGGMVGLLLLSTILPDLQIIARRACLERSRRIGDILRKAVQKAVDAVVRVFRDKFKGLFEGRGAGAQQEENDSQNQGDKPTLTAGDHPRHERFVSERQGLRLEEK